MTQNDEPGDNQEPEQDDLDALEEPFIEGAEPQTPRDFVRDSERDVTTVDDGILATDPDEPETEGGGWSFSG